MSTSRNRQSKKAETAALAKSIRAVDLFCGAGGLTRGLENAGINVALGVDIDPECEYPYAHNNSADFLLKSVGSLSADDFEQAYKDAPFTLLAGCAPCQPFSTYRQGKSGPTDERWNLLEDFGRIVREVQPDLVTMENVPRLIEQEVFEDFVAGLDAERYHVDFKVANCADYGVPQQRNRLVLLASKLGPIKLRGPTTPGKRQVTVRKAIAKLPPLCAGDAHPKDSLHQCSALSPLNLQRIRASRPGGTWRDWDEDLIAACHKKSTGKTYPSVYGRMCWDEPAPTMTTQYFGFGNGRFGHPEQDRAISLREGAILQSFPRKYKFAPKSAPIYTKSIGRLIGNAVPVKLGCAIGRSIVSHVGDHVAADRQAA